MQTEAALRPAERRALFEDIGRIGLLLGRTPGKEAPAAVWPAEWWKEAEQARETRPGQEEQVESVALSPEAHPQASACGECATPFERIALFARLWPEMQSALAAIERCPETCVRGEWQPVRADKARGGPQMVRHLARTPQSAPLTAFPIRRVPLHSSPNSQSAGPPPLIAEERARITHNTPANRLAAALLAALLREAGALAAIAQLCAEEEAAQQVLKLAESVRRWQAAPFLRAISPASQKECQRSHYGLALACLPPYRTLFRGWQALRSPLRLDWTETPLLELPTRDAWQLYEIWCFLQTALALHQAGWRLVAGDCLKITTDGLRLMLATGRTSRLRFLPPDRAAGADQTPLSGRGDGSAQEAGLTPSRRDRRKKSQAEKDILSLFYQPLFASANQYAGGETPAESGGNSLLPESSSFPDEPEAQDHEVFGSPQFVSRSHAMQPDIAIQWRSTLTLLDPKYRAYALPGDEQDDVDKMHAYRDSIVRRDVPARRRAPQAVQSAWCLFPGRPLRPDESPTLAEGVRAYPAPTPERPFGQAGVGAIRLRPACPEDRIRLRLLLNSLLENRE